MIFKVSVLIIMSFLVSPFVISQYHIHSGLLIGVLKKLKNDLFNNIEIIYGSRLLDDATPSGWMMTLILKETSSLMISIKISRIGPFSEFQGNVLIILVDTLNTDEEFITYNKLGDTHSNLILLTKNTSNTFEQMDLVDLAIIGRYTDEKVTFSRTPLVSDLNNGTDVIADCSLDEEFHETPFRKSRIFPTFRSKKLAVLLRNDPPFVIVKSYANGSKYAEGYLVDLWNCITNRLDMSFEIKYFPNEENDDFWNFTDNGFRYEMERSKVDVALFASADPLDLYSNYTGIHTGVHLRLSNKTSILSTITLSLNSFKMFKPQEGCACMHKRRINYYQFVKTINSSCWKILTFIAILSLFLMFIAGNNLADSTFYFLAISFNQGQGETVPRTYSGRIAIISFSISVLGFFYVSSALVTSLSVSGRDLRSTTLEDVVDHSYISMPVIVDYTSAHTMMNYTDLMNNFDKMRRVKMHHATSVREALTVTSRFKWFLFIERERAWPYLEEFKCCVVETDLQKVWPTLFLVRKNSPYTQIFRQESTRLMENGVISRLIKKWWPIIDTSRKEFVPISLSDIFIIFDLLSFGAMVSFLLFRVERHVGVASG